MELNQQMPPTTLPVKETTLNKLFTDKQGRVGLLALGCAAVGLCLPEPRIQAVLAGAITFAVNAGAVFYVAKRLFRGSHIETSNEGAISSTGFLMLALMMKIFGLGACTYLSLIVARLSPLYFVAGAVSVLVFFAMWRLVAYRNNRLNLGIG